MQKTMFSRPALRVYDDVRPRAVHGCGVRKCDVGERRESGQQNGYRESVSGTAGGRRPLVGSPSLCDFVTCVFVVT